jgi:hypothetical protein
MTENKSNILEKNTNIIVNCPHCNNPVLIEKINCGFFRHGILKSNNTQINPHAKKEECDFYINNDLIYGCGKPFRILEIDEFKTEICEYI